MTVRHKLWFATKDATVANTLAGTSYGAGKGPVLFGGWWLQGDISGAGNDVKTRPFVDFDEDWTGVRQIVKAELLLQGAFDRDPAGANAHVKAQRASAGFQEGTNGSLSTANGGGITWDNQPGVTGTVSPVKDISGIGKGTLFRIDVSAAIDEIAPAGVKKRNGVAGSGNGTLNGFRLQACHADGTVDETVAAYHFVLASRDNNLGATILLDLTYDDNLPPGTPNTIIPQGGAAVGLTSSAASIPFSAKIDDPDPGDGVQSIDLQIFPSSATDGSPGTPVFSARIQRNGTPWITVSGTTVNVHGFSPSLTTPLTGGVLYRWRLRGVDADGAAGPWSSLATGLFRWSTIPKGKQASVDPDSLTPNFYITLDDPDPGEFVGAYRIEVFRFDSTGASTAMWDTGKITVGSGTQIQVAYGSGGSAIGPLDLAWNVPYKWRYTIWDASGIPSATSALVAWTPTQNTGPTNMTPRTTTSAQQTRTPTLSINNSVNFTAWQLQVSDRADGATLLWNIPSQAIASTATKALTYGNNAGLSGPSAATALDWGHRYYWRSAIDTGSGMGAWSPWYPFYVNALPTTSITWSGLLSTVASVVRSDGVAVVPLTNGDDLSLFIPFVDNDTAQYGDVPSRHEIEIRNVASLSAALGAGTLFEDRVSTSIGLTTSTRKVGQQVSNLDSVTGWTKDADATLTLTADSGTKAEGVASQKIAFSAACTAKTYVNTGANFAAPIDMSGYEGGALISGKVNVSANLANLSSVRIRFVTTSGNYYEVSLGKPGATGSFATLTAAWSTRTTTGTPNVASIARIDTVVILGVGGAALNVFLDDVIAGTRPALETYYDVRSRFRDANTESVDGTWTGWSRGRASAPASVTPTAPANGGTITDPTTAFTWSYSSPSAKAQATYQVVAYDASGVQAWDSGVVVSAATSATIPPWLLTSGVTYSWAVTVTDADGLATTSATWTFVTSFTQPPVLTGLVLTPDLTTAFVGISWSASGIAAGEFNEYQVWRRSLGDAVYVRIDDGSLTSQGTSLSWTDTEPNVGGVQVAYQVMVDNGALTSDPLEGATQVNSFSCWITSPLDPSANIEIWSPVALTDSYPSAQEIHDDILGRSKALVEIGGDLGRRGRLTMDLLPEERPKLDQILALRTQITNGEIPYVTIRDTNGRRVRVVPGTVDRNPSDYGMDTPAFDWVEVA